MQLDYGRQKDLDQLYEDYQKEKSSFWREKIEQTMSQILNESGSSRQLRDQLIKATRAGDMTHIKYCQEELRRLDADKVNNHIQL
jgi:Na+-transporting NADH:ubiquinone oxidoreductase subunit NqrA